MAAQTRGSRSKSMDAAGLSACIASERIDVISRNSPSDKIPPMLTRLSLLLIYLLTCGCATQQPGSDNAHPP
jgi:hypothetical protein